MPVRYFKPAGTSWNNPNDWASTVGGVDNAGVPAVADDVVFDNASGNCNLITTNAVCRSFDMGTGATKYGGTFSGNATLSVGTSSAPPGGILIRLSSTCTWSHTGTVSSANATFGATTVTITTAGKVFGSAFSCNANGSGTVQLVDALTCSGTFSKGGSGTIDLNNQSVTCVSYSWTGNSAGTINCGSSIVTITSTNLVLSAGGSSPNGVLNANTSEWKMIGSATSVLNVSGTAKTFYKFTRVGTAVKTDALSINANFTVTNILTWQGNTIQGVNRLLVQSDVRGTQRTINCTGATVVFAGDADFMDIAHSGSPTIDVTAGAWIGDCGGNNSVITINRTTPVATGYTSVASDNFSTVARWSVRVPLPQDTVTVVAITAGTVTVDMPRIGKDVDFTGTTRTVTPGTNEMYGNLIAASTMTWGGSSALALAGRGTQTITFNGVVIPYSILIYAVGGSYTFQDAASLSRANSPLTLQSGTLNDNGMSVAMPSTASKYSQNAQSASVLNASGVWTLGSVSAGVSAWEINAGTVVHTGSITYTAATTNNRTFVGGGGSYNTLVYTVANSPGALVITGANTFTGTTPLNIGPGRSVVFTQGTTQSFPNGNPVYAGQHNGYLYFAGDSASFVSAPDIAAYTGAGIMRGVIRINMDDWTPTATNTLLAHTQSNPNFGWQFGVTTTGAMRFQASSDGITAQVSTVSSAPTLTDTVTYWVGFEYNTATGVLTYYKANDTGNNIPPAFWAGWTQVSTHSLTALVPFNSTARITVGNSDNGGAFLLGAKVYYAAFYTNTNTLAFEVDLTRNVNSDGWLDAAKTQFVETSPNAATVTINGASQAGDGRVVVASSVAGSPATHSLESSSILVARKITVKDINVLPKGHMYALESADISGNDGITFNKVPGFGIAA